MKNSLLPFLAFVCFLSLPAQKSFSQTKILDSNVDWNSHTLTVFLSDSGNVTSLEVSLGTTLTGTDVYHQTLNLGSGVTPSGDQLTASLNGITPGAYYLDLKLTLSDASVKEMQYQTPAQ